MNINHYKVASVSSDCMLR